MITVLCANPALDVTYVVERVRRGAVHAVAGVRRRAGGKGGNVAHVLRQLDEPVRLVAPLGGAAGEQYAAQVRTAGIELVAVPVTAPPRTSVCVVDDDATVFNEPGPELSAAEWAAVVDATLAAPGEVLVLSGSLPKGVPDDAYAALVAASQARTIVDARGAALAAAAAAGADVVAPNLSEVQGILDVSDLTAAAQQLCAQGARAAVVSAGADGVVAVTGAGTWRAVPPRIEVGNPTGAGDALTAELARGLAHDAPWPDVLRAAVASASATLAAPTAGQFDAAERRRVLEAVVVEAVAACR